MPIYLMFKKPVFNNPIKISSQRKSRVVGQFLVYPLCNWIEFRNKKGRIYKQIYIAFWCWHWTFQFSGPDYNRCIQRCTRWHDSRGLFVLKFHCHCYFEFCCISIILCYDILRFLTKFGGSYSYLVSWWYLRSIPRWFSCEIWPVSAQSDYHIFLRLQPIDNRTGLFR